MSEIQVHTAAPELEFFERAKRLSEKIQDTKLIAAVNVVSRFFDLGIELDQSQKSALRVYL